jgi:hypothetical protein
MNVGMTPEARERLRTILKDRDLTKQLMKTNRDYYNERGDVNLETFTKMESIAKASSGVSAKELALIFRELATLSEMIEGNTITTLHILEGLALNQIDLHDRILSLVGVLESSGKEARQEAFDSLRVELAKLGKDVKKIKKHGVTLRWIEDYMKRTKGEPDE